MDDNLMCGSTYKVVWALADVVWKSEFENCRWSYSGLGVWRFSNGFLLYLHVNV